MDFKLGELFCGAGGLAWGALNAGQDRAIGLDGDRYTISHAWASDIDEAACRTYAANLLLDGTDNEDEIDQSVAGISNWEPSTAKSVICGPVEDLMMRVNDLPDIDALAFGFPCNDFSAVGERKGMDGSFGPLYSNGVEVLNAKKPRWFVAENVEGLLHRDKQRLWPRIKNELEQAGPGYHVTEHLYRFEQYGVPQYRARLVVVGISNPDAANGITYEIPEPTTRDGFRTAQWAMEHDPTDPDVIKVLTTEIPNHKFKRIFDQVRRRLEHTKPGQNAWTADIPPDCALHVKNAHLSMIYRRLVADEPAYTITGNGGGGTHGYHWSEARALTNRERARLQSFPDAFRFYGGEASIRRQIGMAVPPLAAKVIFEAILKTYARQPYGSVPPTTAGSAERRRRETCARGRTQNQVALSLETEAQTVGA